MHLKTTEKMVTQWTPQGTARNAGMQRLASRVLVSLETIVIDEPYVVTANEKIESLSGLTFTRLRYASLE